MADTRSIGPHRYDLTTVVALLAIGSAVAMLATITGGRAAGTDVWMVVLLALILIQGLRRPDLGVYLLAFAVPFEFFFFAWGSGRYQMLAYPALALAVFWTSTSNSFRGRLLHHEVWVLSLLAWATVSLAWTPDAVTGVQAIFSLAGAFAFLYVIPRAVSSEAGILRLLGFFVAGLLIYSVILALYYDRSLWVEFYGKQYLSQFGAAEEVSPYEYGNACLVAVFACLGLWEFSPSRITRRLGLALGVVFVGGLLLTLSRAFMVELAVGMVAWTLLARARRGLSFRIPVVIVLVGLGLGLAFGVNPLALDFRTDHTLLMLQHDDIQSVTSGRISIWGVGWEIFRANPLMGVGIGNFGDAYAGFTATRVRGSHSSVIRFMAELGAPGLLLFIGFLGALGMMAWRSGKWRPVTMAWWCYFVIEGALNGHARNKAAWMAVGMIALMSIQAARLSTGDEEDVRQGAQTPPVPTAAD